MVAAVHLTRKTLSTIRANLIWAFGYNLVTVPLAATGWLNPMFAAVAMSASSVLVVANSLRLRAYAPPGHRYRSASASAGKGGPTPPSAADGVATSPLEDIR